MNLKLQGEIAFADSMISLTLRCLFLLTGGHFNSQRPIPIFDFYSTLKNLIWHAISFLFQKISLQIHLRFDRISQHNPMMNPAKITIPPKTFMIIRFISKIRYKPTITPMINGLQDRGETKMSIRIRIKSTIAFNFYWRDNGEFTGEIQQVRWNDRLCNNIVVICLRYPVTCFV